MKKCPYCAEEIQDEAVLCRHCGKDLPQAPQKIVSEKTNLLQQYKWPLLVVLAVISLVFWYVSVPMLALWFIWKKTKLDRQKKIIGSAIIVVICVLAFGDSAHHNRAPQITIMSPAEKISVQAKEYEITGSVKPAYAQVTINNNDLNQNTSDGSFKTTEPLSAETNTFTITAKNGGNTVTKTVTITRIYTDEEKATQVAQKAAQEKAAKEKADQAAKAKAAADLKAKQEQAAYDNSKAGRLCKAHSGWTKDDCQRLADNRYWIGMTYDMLVVLRGKANNINPSNYGSGTSYQYCWNYYSPSCFYDRNGDGVLDSYN